MSPRKTTRKLVYDPTNYFGDLSGVYWFVRLQREKQPDSVFVVTGGLQYIQRVVQEAGLPAPRDMFMIDEEIFEGVIFVFDTEEPANEFAVFLDSLMQENGYQLDVAIQGPIDRTYYCLPVPNEKPAGMLVN